jgi:hypothetical protein
MAGRGRGSEMSRTSGSLQSPRQVFTMFLWFALAATASAQCYQFSGPSVTLQINVTTINLQLGPSFVAGGFSTTYTHSGANSFTLGGVNQTSQSAFDGMANIQYLPPSGPGLSDDATTFQVVVPNADPPGKERPLLGHPAGQQWQPDSQRSPTSITGYSAGIAVVSSRRKQRGRLELHLH